MTSCSECWRPRSARPAVQGSSVERYGVVPAIEAIVDELHRTKARCNELTTGAAYKQLSDEHHEQQQRMWSLEAALTEATNMLEGRAVDLAKVEEWRRLAKE
jgi:hypothetical protein